MLYIQDREKVRNPGSVWGVYRSDLNLFPVVWRDLVKIVFKSGFEQNEQLFLRCSLVVDIPEK